MRQICGLLALSVFLFCLSPGHAEKTTDRISAIRIPGIANVIKAQRGGDGTIHLLFDAEDGPRYANSPDDGQTFRTPIAIVDRAAEKPGLKFSAWDLAVGPEGRVHVAMSNNAWKLKLPQEEWSFYYASLEPGAKTFTPVRSINRKPSEGFSLAADEHGAVTACFLSGKLFTMISRDGGKTFGPSAELNPAWNPCDCCTTSAAYGSDGKLALLYREETNNERDIHVIVWNQSEGTKPARLRVSGTSWNIAGCPMSYYTIAPRETGYVAVWPTKGNVYFAKIDANGGVLPPGEVRTPGTSGMRTGLLALTAADGATLVAWKNNEVLGWQLYDAESKPMGNPGSAPSAGNGAAGVALPDGRFLLFP